MKQVLIVVLSTLALVTSGCSNISDTITTHNGTDNNIAQGGNSSLEQEIFVSGIGNVIHTVEKKDHAISFAYDDSVDKGKVIVAKYSKTDGKWHYHGNSAFSSDIEPPTIYFTSKWKQKNNSFILVHAGVIKHPDLTKVIVENNDIKSEASYAEKDGVKLWYYIEEVTEQDDYGADSIIVLAKNGDILYQSNKSP